MIGRITGTEMEYGLTVQFKEGQPYKVLGDESKSIRQDITSIYSPEDSSYIRQFRTNGGRLYPEFGGHPEYATPEDDSIYGTVANEIAGEEMVYDSLVNTLHSGRINGFRLNKRVVDHTGVTWGHHENFSVASDQVEISASGLALLGLHLATINIFTGAGAVIFKSNGSAGRFVLSQKSNDIQDAYSSTTTRQKPLVNLKKEAHADERWSRVHVTSGDANMSPWAMRMRLGTTSLVLRLIESGHKSKIETLERVDSVAREVSKDTLLQRPIRMEGGFEYRAVDIQAKLVEELRAMVETIDVPEEELAVLGMWEMACEDARKDPLLLADRADWVAKWMMLQNFMERKNLDWSSRRVQYYDKLWDDLGPNGIGLKLRKTVWAEWMPDEALILSRRSTSPSTTRANVRSKFIEHFSEIDGWSAVDWEDVCYEEELVYLGNPNQSQNDRVDELIEKYS